MHSIDAAQERVICAEARLRLPCPNDLSSANLADQCPGDPLCHLVLNSEKVFEVSIIALGPDVIASGRFYQLRSDPDASSSLSNASSTTYRTPSFLPTSVMFTD